MKILIYFGTSRKDNYSQHALRFIKEQLDEREDVETTVVSTKEFPIRHDDEGESAAYPELTQKIIEADGIVIVSPEYNHGYPGSLKYLLDLNFKEFFDKPVGIVSVSDGQFGGVRMVESLIHVLKTLGMVMIKPDVNFTMIKDEVDETGQFKDPAKWARRSKRMIDELLKMVQIFKNAA